MPDDRDRRNTPTPGVPVRGGTASRIAPRDTQDMIRDLARDIESLGERTHTDIERLTERIDARLNQGAEKFIRMDERVTTAIATAGEAKRDVAFAEANRIQEALKAKTIPWTRVIPISLSILVLAGTIALAMDRKVNADKFDLASERADARARALEEQITKLDKELAVSRTSAQTLQAVLDTVSKAIKTPDVVTGRRPK